MQNRTYTYEAMFLIGQAAAADLTSVIAHINEIFARSHAEVLAMKKWDERRLAFEIKKQKRGLYILAYFKASNTVLPQIERDCNLSEKILRVMILRADHLTPDEMLASDAREALETEAKLRTKQAEEMATNQANQAAGIAAQSQQQQEVEAPEGEPAEA
jgi:small subunit ribosomal protein S6